MRVMQSLVAGVSCWRRVPQDESRSLTAVLHVLELHGLVAWLFLQGAKRLIREIFLVYKLSNLLASIKRIRHQPDHTMTS